MGNKRTLLIIGLITCLFSTSFAKLNDPQIDPSTGAWPITGDVNPGDANMKVSLSGNGAAGSSEGFCIPCKIAELANYELTQNTRGSQTPGGGSYEDGGRAGQQ